MPSSRINIPACILHASAAYTMAWGFKRLDTTILDSWIRSQIGGHFQFLTIQSLSIAWITMLLSLAADLLPSVTLAKRAKRAFFLIALPLSVVVTTIYWMLILLAPHMMVPDDSVIGAPSSSDKQPQLVRIPLKLDLALHAAPALSLLTDFFAFEKSYGDREASSGAALVAALFTVWYASWVEYCATFNGVFPYPFLTHNPLKIRILIYTGAGLLAFISFQGINAIHNLLNTSSSDSSHRKRVD